jgi:cobalt-zinc-cadmium efflux system outer membrane protein
VDAALRHRPEIQSIAWRLEALGDDRALAWLLPWEGTSAGAEAERDEGEGWSVGPAVSVPLPAFDLGQARAARVTAEQIEARHDLTAAKRAVVEEVRRAFESLARTEANLRRVRQELIPLQQQRQSLAEASFRAGQSDVTALFLAEQDLRDAEAQAVELERQTTIALLRLQRAAGGAGVARRMVAEASLEPEEVR